MIFVDRNAISARIQNFEGNRRGATRREPREPAGGYQEENQEETKREPRRNQEESQRKAKGKPEDSQRKAKATVRKYPPLKLTKTVPNEQIDWENPGRAT